MFYIMKKNILKFFTIFFFIFLIVLLLYLSKLDINYFLSQYIKIIFAFIYSLFIAFYFTYFILFNSKKGKIFLFLSFLFTIIILTDFKNNLLIIYILKILNLENISMFIYILFALISIVLLLIADFIQIKHNPLTKKEQKEEDIFI